MLRNTPKEFRVYRVSVTCSDGTNRTADITCKNRAMAAMFANGIASVYSHMGKNVIQTTIKFNPKVY